MDASKFVSPGNVEEVTANILFMQLSDVKSEYVLDALSYSDSLAHVWCDYAKADTNRGAKLAELMQAVVSMMNILTPSAKQKLFKRCIPQKKLIAYN